MDIQELEQLLVIKCQAAEVYRLFRIVESCFGRDWPSQIQAFMESLSLLGEELKILDNY